MAIKWVELFEDWELTRTYKGLTGIRAFRNFTDNEEAKGTLDIPNIGDPFEDPINATPLQGGEFPTDSGGKFGKLICLKIREKKFGTQLRTKLVCEYGYPEDEDVSDIIGDTDLVSFPNNIELTNEFMHYTPEAGAWVFLSDAANVTDPLIVRTTTAKWYFVKVIQDYDNAIDTIRPMIETVNASAFGRLTDSAVSPTFDVWTLLFEGVKFKFFLNHNQQERWMVTFNFLYKQTLGLGDASVPPDAPIGWNHQMRPDGTWDIPCFGDDPTKLLYAESNFADLYELT